MARNRVQHDVATATAGPDLRAIVTAGLVGLAATLWAVQSRAADQPVIVAHGTADPVVPMQAGQLAFNALKYAGFNVRWQDYRMEHSVCAQEVADISRFIQQQLLVDFQCKLP